MRPDVVVLGTSDSILFTFGNADDPSQNIETFLFDFGTVLKGRASGAGVTIVAWPGQAVFTMTNTATVARTVNLYFLNPNSTDQIPILSPNFKLNAGFYAIFAPDKISVYTPDGRSTTDVGYLMQEYTGTWANPNGHVIPDNPNAAASYYLEQDGDDIDADYTEWRWSPANQKWFKTIGN